MFDETSNTENNMNSTTILICRAPSPRNTRTPIRYFANGQNQRLTETGNETSAAPGHHVFLILPLRGAFRVQTVYGQHLPAA